jgi:hypothetical protein
VGFDGKHGSAMPGTRAQGQSDRRSAPIGPDFDNDAGIHVTGQRVEKFGDVERHHPRREMDGPEVARNLRKSLVGVQPSPETLGPPFRPGSRRVRCLVCYGIDLDGCDYGLSSAIPVVHFRSIGLCFAHLKCELSRRFMADLTRPTSPPGGGVVVYGLGVRPIGAL